MKTIPENRTIEPSRFKATNEGWVLDWMACENLVANSHFNPYDITGRAHATYAAMRKIGGRSYAGRSYGGGIVFEEQDREVIIDAIYDSWESEEIAVGIDLEPLN